MRSPQVARPAAYRGAEATSMPRMRDEVLNRDGETGNYVVGFFPGDGDDADRAVLRAYRAMRFKGVRGVYRRYDLVAVEHEGMDLDAAYGDESVLAAKRAEEACAGMSAQEVTDLVVRHRHRIQRALRTGEVVSC